MRSRVEMLWNPFYCANSEGVFLTMNRIFSNRRKWLLVMLPITLTLVVGMMLGTGCSEEEKPPIVFADLNWSSAEIQTRIAGYIIEHGYGYPTEMIVSDTVSQFPALANDSVHISMEVWLPNAQEAYDKALDTGTILDVGKSIEDNWQAWVIPQYVKDENPGLVSVTDLPAHMELFVTPDSNGKARLVTCIPGWACEMVNANKVTAYELEDTVELLNPGSGASLFADLEGAYGRGDAWLGYLWGPTKPAAELDLYRLEEPPYSEECWESHQGCAYPTAEVKIVVTKTLNERAPEVIEFLEKYNLAASAQITTEAWMTDNNETPEAAAIWYLNNYRDVWTAWISDDTVESVDDALAEEG